MKIKASCFCCRRWRTIHETPYGEGAGCFPLCEACWQRLPIDRRLYYYRQLWYLWSDQNRWTDVEPGYVDRVSELDAKWTQIEAVVRSGG